MCKKLHCFFSFRAFKKLFLSCLMFLGIRRHFFNVKIVRIGLLSKHLNSFSISKCCKGKQDYTFSLPIHSVEML